MIIITDFSLSLSSFGAGMETQGLVPARQALPLSHILSPWGFWFGLIFVLFVGPWFFETGPLHPAQAGLQFAILLPFPPKWDCRHGFVFKQMMVYLKV
jgi:hypothetical protein